MKIRPSSDPTPPKLPERIQQLRSAVHQQIDICLEGAQGDEQFTDLAMRSTLMELTSEARKLRPLNPTTDEQKRMAKQVANLHGLACRVAAYAGFAATSAPAGLSMQATRSYMEAMQQQLDSSIESVFSAAPATPIQGKPPRDGLIETVDVPAGNFKFGMKNEEKYLPGFKISKYPVTNEQFLEFIQSTGYQPEGVYVPPEGGAYGEGPMNLGAHPAPMTYYDLKAFAEWVGGVVPTREQWEKAGRGPNGNKYPWGDEFDPRACNCDSSSTTAVNRYETINEDGRANVSYYGAVDMAGNMLEWVDGGAARRPGAAYLKGGAWSNYVPTSGEIPFDLIRETSETPDSRYTGFGGRVAFVEDSPATRDAAKQSASPVILDTVGAPAPASPMVRLPKLEKEVRKLVSGESHNALTLQEQLQQLCQQVREQRPLTSLGEDSEVKLRINRILAAANRMSFYASVAASADPTTGATLSQVGDLLQTGLKGLKQDLAAVQQAAPVQKIEPSEDNPAGVEWVEIPAGKFLFGRDNEPRELPAYRIAKYPITNQQFGRFVEATGYQAEGGFQLPSGGFAGEEADFPVATVSFFDMQAFARWAVPGGKVPSHEQWEKAARGAEGQLYPWGNEFDPQRVNHDSGDRMSVYEMERRGNVSPFGVADMVGNCLEWVDASTPGRPGSTMLKGGAYSNSTGGLKVQSTTRYTTDLPNVGYSGFGGRICAPALS